MKSQTKRNASRLRGLVSAVIVITALTGAAQAVNTWAGAGGGGGLIAVWYGVRNEDRDRVVTGDMKRVKITTTHPVFLGTTTAAGGFDGSGGKLLATGGNAGSVVFLTVLPPAGTVIMIR